MKCWRDCLALWLLRRHDQEGAEQREVAEQMRLLQQQSEAIKARAAELERLAAEQASSPVAYSRVL